MVRSDSNKGRTHVQAQENTSHARAPRPRLVEGEVDADRHRHAADSRQQRQREPPPLPQLAQIELAPRFEAYDEKEQGHQAAVHPLAKIKRDLGAAQVDRQRRPPERVIGRRVDVHPDECRDGRRQQDRRAAGLGAQELAQRRLEAPSPGRSSRSLSRGRGTVSESSLEKIATVPTEAVKEGNATRAATVPGSR